MVVSKTPKKRTTTTKKKSTKKAAFGGYKINFNGYSDSLEKVFGTKPIAPSQMTKQLWAYVKKYKLHNK